MPAAHGNQRSRRPALELLPAATRKARVQAVLQDLLTRLQCTAPTADDIHDIRVDIKKLRSWIRLLRRIDARGTGRLADAALRDVAAGFAAVRDQHVLQQTLALLQQRCADSTASAQLATLLPALEARTPARPSGVFTDATAQRLHRLCARMPDTRPLLTGLRRSYRRARRLGKQACAVDATPALRHRWRKRVKYLGYQLHFVCGAEPGQGQSLPAALAKLGNALGTLQDLTVLERQLVRLGPAAADTDAVVLATRLLQRERRRQLVRIARLYRRCFAAKQPGLSAGS